MNSTMKNNIIIASPFIIIFINYIVAIISGNSIGKWAFIPIILIEWILFCFFIIWAENKETLKQWLKRPIPSLPFKIVAILTGLIPLPLFILHHELLSSWEILLPWIILALFNPWIEEFYWRGLLMKHTEKWGFWKSVVFTSFVFALNHLVFGVNSELNRGLTVFLATFIMGFFWAIIFVKTKSLRWVILAHFFVDILNLSTVSFLDLY